MEIAAAILFGAICFLLGVVYQQTIVNLDLEDLFKDENGKETNEETNEEENNYAKSNCPDGEDCEGCYWRFVCESDTEGIREG